MLESSSSERPWPMASLSCLCSSSAFSAEMSPRPHSRHMAMNSSADAPTSFSFSAGSPAAARAAAGSCSIRWTLRFLLAVMTDLKAVQRDRAGLTRSQILVFYHFRPGCARLSFSARGGGACVKPGRAGIEWACGASCAGKET